MSALLAGLALLLATVGSALADVHYVDLNCTNATPPYTNWATAATNIQDAVDASVAGDEVVVTNGIYATGGRTIDGVTTNRVTVDKPLILRSVNGSQLTTIDGGGLVRCAYLTNNASVSGFTLFNGYVNVDGGPAGAGVFCASSSVLVSNCVLSGNQSYVNVIRVGTFPGGSGGGAYDCTLNNCTLAYNRISVLPIGVGRGQAFGGGAANCTLNNCTLAGNSIDLNPGFTAGGGAYGGTLNNCIVYFNTNYYGANYDSSCTLNYCCTTPQSTSGFDNITNTPLFVDMTGGDLRLQSNSPCINTGNNAFAPAGPDPDGNPRIAGGTVDIGAYEFQSPVSQISYAWLQQYGLPINSLADTADPDGDGVDNYHEWLANSDPTNPFSFPPPLTLIPYEANVILTWPTNAYGFTVQSTTNLNSLSGWTTNSPAPVVIGGQNVVINPVSGAQQFYRLIH